MQRRSNTPLPQADSPRGTQLKAKRFPWVNIVGLAILLAWLGPGVGWLITRNERSAFMIAAFTNGLCGVVFLSFCLPFARFMDRSQKEMLGPHLPKLLDLIVRFFLVHIGWPHTTMGWIITNALLAGVFFFAAICMFLLGTGDTVAADSLMQWFEDTLGRMFGHG